MSNILDSVYTTIIDRKNSADTDGSWTAQLLAGGTEKICKKLSEETAETVIGAIKNDTDNVIYESADVLYHLMVLWADQGISVDQVMSELSRRQGVSGITEKNMRK